MVQSHRYLSCIDLTCTQGFTRTDIGKSLLNRISQTTGHYAHTRTRTCAHIRAEGNEPDCGHLKENCKNVKLCVAIAVRDFSTDSRIFTLADSSAAAAVSWRGSVQINKNQFNQHQICMGNNSKGNRQQANVCV